MKFFIVFGFMALVVVASAGHATSYQNIHRYEHGGNGGGNDGGNGGEISGEHHEDFDHHPQYKYEYGVKDHKTGDNKDAWEHRDGDVVKGSYTLKESDGTERIVEYTADKHHGFNAHVKRVGHAIHPHIYGNEHGIGGEGGL